MAINFPDSPTNGQVATIGGKNYTYNSTKNTWTPTQVTEADLSSIGSTTVVATHDLLPSSPSAGDMALVSSVNKMYVYFLSGWWLMSSLQNASPSGITGNAAIYDLAADGTPTTVTLSSSDPEGFPIVWSHSVISGSLGGTTVTNVNNVFTITPSTDAADAGTFTLRFAASDGQGGESGSQSQFTLDFVFTVTNSRYTSLLATATGTSDNNDITDASTNNHFITVNGDAHAGTFSPYRSGGYSTYFDGSGDYLSIAQTTDTNLTGDFTVECWVYLNEDKNQFFLSKWANPSDFGWNLFAYGGDSIVFYTGNSGNVGTLIDFNYNPPLQQWMHVAVSRTSNTISGYVNGTRKVVMGNITSNCTSNTSLTIGGDGSSWSLNGYLRDVRIVNGTGLYSGTSITIPESPPTAITNTKVLLGDLPYFKDQSALNHAITVNGNPSTKPFSPYDYNEYSAADNGGSVHFDGSGDNLQTANTISLSGDFTVSAWVYLQGTSKAVILGSTYPPNYQFFIDSSNVIGFHDNTTTENGTGIVQRDKWNYCVWSRSGSNISMYVNGESRGTETSSATFQIRFVGSLANTYDFFNGYISDLQIKTTSTSAANAVPPTAPLSSSGTSLHIKGTDASIIDKSQGTNLKLFGNTTGSTTQVKFANSKSMYFDGSGDYILSQEPVKLGTQDFTAECWLYYQSGLELMGNRTVSDSGGFSVRISSTTLTVGNSSGTGFGSVFSGTTSSLTNSWHHIAVSRSSGVTKIYVDGTSIASHSNSIDFSLSNPFVIGYAYTNGSGADPIQGYIQDFRITNGLARYTANFTPPTASLEG